MALQKASYPILRSISHKEIQAGMIFHKLVDIQVLKDDNMLLYSNIRLHCINFSPLILHIDIIMQSNVDAKSNKWKDNYHLYTSNYCIRV